jgi:hypothetical protein
MTFAQRDVLLILVIVSVLSNLLLSQHAARPSAASEERPARGTIVPPLIGTDTAGVARSIDYDTTDLTVVYYFDPTCSWTKRNWQSVRSLQQITADRVRFVGAAAGVVSQMLADAERLTFEVVGGLSEAQRRAYDFGSAPRTVVIGRGGRVRRAWRGAFMGNLRGEIERYFGVSLPVLQTSRR